LWQNIGIAGRSLESLGGAMATFVHSLVEKITGTFKQPHPKESTLSPFFLGQFRLLWMPFTDSIRTFCICRNAPQVIDSLEPSIPRTPQNVLVT